MPLIVPNNLRGVLKHHETKRLATCWTIARRDGVTLRFTDHDAVITIDGNEFTPVSGVNASARRREDALKPHDVQFIGVIDDDAITDEDLLAGRYDEAEVIETMVDWSVPWAGRILSFRYWVDRAGFNGEIWQASVTGASRFLRQNVGDVAGRTCQHDLGVVVDGKGCTIDLLAYTVTPVNVEGMVDGEKRRVIRANTTDLSGGFADDWFANGTVEFTSGLNVGIRGEVKSYTAATREITMQLPFPFTIARNDEFTLIAGCRKRFKPDCIDKFSNGIEFGGEPYMPGTDRVLRSPVR